MSVYVNFHGQTACVDALIELGKLDGERRIYIFATLGSSSGINFPVELLKHGFILVFGFYQDWNSYMGVGQYAIHLIKA